MTSVQKYEDPLSLSISPPLTHPRTQTHSRTHALFLVQ